MNNTKITAAITGHRPNKMFGYDLSDKRYTDIQKAIAAILEQENVTDLWTGMALGTDHLAALAAIGMQDSGAGIRLHAAVPFKGHKDARWPKKTQDLYDAILSRCTEITLVTDAGFSCKALEDRNRYMCDHSDILIAVYNGAPGGTANCIRYARRTGMPIWFIDPNDPKNPVRVPDNGTRIAWPAGKAGKQAPGLYTGSFSSISPERYDEIWLTVRRLRFMPENPAGNIFHVPLLSPSEKLLDEYLSLKDKGTWDEQTFHTFYAPRFLSEMLEPESHEKLRELYRLTKTKAILCVCFCSDSRLCHRSLIKAILYAMSVNEAKNQ